MPRSASTKSWPRPKSPLTRLGAALCICRFGSPRRCCSAPLPRAWRLPKAAHFATAHGTTACSRPARSKERITGMGSSLAWLPSFCMRSSGIERPAIARVYCPIEWQRARSCRPSAQVSRQIVVGADHVLENSGESHTAAIGTSMPPGWELLSYSKSTADIGHDRVSFRATAVTSSSLRHCCSSVSGLPRPEEAMIAPSDLCNTDQPADSGASASLLPGESHSVHHHPR
jgi:hypothetical protein